MAQKEFQDFEVDVDLTNVEAWDGAYKLVAPGEYAMTLVHLEKKNSKKSQQPMIVVTFEIIDEGEFKGSKLFGNYSLSADARGRLKALSVACNAQVDKFIASQHLGQTIIATVVHTEGAADIGPDGAPRPPKVFANVGTERPYEEVAEVEAPPAPPANKAKVATKPAANGAARRA